MQLNPASDSFLAKPANFLVVGLGASAGGIQALQKFFEHVPEDSHSAYVVILHLSPDHDSQLAQVLQAVTTLPVTQVTKKTELAPNHIYVVSPNQHLGLEEDSIVPSPNLYLEERRAPVDIFFRNLADSHGPRALCVVLSGTGADGSMGLKRVKERGGVAYAQSPREAEFNEMPRNAIATELIDEVLPVAEIPGRIIAYRNSLGRVALTEGAASQAEQHQQALRELFAHLRLRTGHDFSNYKRATLLRRIERRLHVRSLPDLPSYVAYLQQQPEESQALLKDLLISVTNFFRDKKPFHTLEQEVLPTLFQSKGAESEIRIWVAGCATGEEAYSLAMLAAERTWGVLDAPKVQLFATDIDEAALTAAREGLYTLNDAADVSPERLLRFFTKEGDGYRIHREIREMILFANHNFLKDPPFSRLNLVTCRNVLIYLNATAQERVLETFHFALKPGGFLFLGSAESIDGASELYATVSRENHLYRARETVLPKYPVPEPGPVLHARPPISLPPAVGESKPANPLSLGEWHQHLLEDYAPPSLVVNEDYDLVHLSEKAGRFLEFSGGAPTKNLLELIQPELRLELRAVLHQVQQQQTSVEARNLPWTRNGKRQSVTIQAKPVTRGGDTTKGFMLVFFQVEEPGLAPAPEPIVRRSEEPIARQLEVELLQVKTQLRRAVEQHDYQAKDLRVSNEELQAMNEELRSAAEELETSKEELQSINEELRTVNQELKVKIEEISVTSNNLQNLIHSAGVATIFLDRAFCIRLYTPAARQLFNLIPSDHGRPISDITHRLAYDHLLADAETVLEKLTPLEREVTTTDQRTFLMRVLPYRTAEDRINGVVITLFDITDRKRTEETLQASEQRLQRMINVPGVGVLTFDYADTILQANDAFLAMVGYTRPEFAARRFTWQDFTPPEYTAISQQVLTTLRQTGRGGPYEKEYFHKDGTRLWLMFVAADLGDGTIAEYVIDMSARKLAEEAVASDLAGMQRLHELHAKLATETDLQAALAELVALACDFTQTDQGCVQLVSDDGQRLELFACQGYEESNQFGEHLQGEGAQAAFEAARHERTRVLVEDIATDSSFLLSSAGREIALAEGIRAFQATLLLTRSNDLVGVLSTQFRQPHRPTDHELRLLDLLAWTAADFVERHRAVQALHAFSVGLEHQVQERTTQLRLSAETLQRNVAKLQQAEEVAQMGSWEYDLASGELSWSVGMYRLFNLPVGSPVRPDLYLRYVIAEDQAVARKLVHQFQAKHEPLDETLRLEVEGVVHTFRIKSIVLRNDLGEPEKLLGLDLDVSEVKRLEEENLQMRLNQQKALLLGILDAQEEERRRIAESLHNGVGQLLFAAKLNFDRVAKLVPPEVFKNANQLLDEAIQETRKVSHELVPTALNKFGLAKSIKDLCKNYTQTRIRIYCEVAGLEDRLEPYLEVAIYRICQELLTNVMKHAEATRADILLEQEDGAVTLKVRDNGKGVNPELSQSAGIGLRTIQDRVNLLNGTFSLHPPATSTGTQVTVRIPITGASG
ncbi:CheR family methyltransferase [Hymenobacter sp. YC55]|uniref:CheR family methyltransferase n=1 Tax=Hymenobacter sp. YC55 TaxID=3034019 RepID=UPI0023F65C23|nr:CheR family methyltransferase [Hymenobacter sp. YC55]MDF7815714.1 CheR family methyltransferase [Hymenobacter sp. YC55]